MSAAIENALRVAVSNTERAPTDAQKEAGNYAKGKLQLHGLDIAIENPKGGERSGLDRGGKRWRVTMPAHYGYVLGTEGRDGDHLDVYIGPDLGSRKVFVVDQIDAESGKFDEHKAMLCYQSKTSALADYEKAFSDGKGKDRIGAVTQMDVDEFKAWARSGDTKKPLGDVRKGYAAGGAVEMTSNPKARALHLARGYASGGAPKGDWRSDVDGGDPFEGEANVVRPRRTDITPEEIATEALHASRRSRSLGLPDFLEGQLRDAQREEGPFAESNRANAPPRFIEPFLDVAHVGAELTGVPSLVRGAGNIRRGLDEGDWMRGAAGAGEMALGAIPGAAATRGGQKALSAILDAPWRAGVAGGSLGVPGALLETREAKAQGASVEERVTQKLRAMSPQQLKDYQSAIGAVVDGKVGRDTISKAVAHESAAEAAREEARAAASEKAAADRAVAMELAKGKSAAEVEAAKIKAGAEARLSTEKQQRSDRTNLPIRELYPEVMPWIPVVAGAVAGLTGGAIKKGYTSQYNRALDDLIPRWQAAVDARDPALAGAIKSQVEALRKAGPGGTKPALAAGAAEGTLIGLAPEEIDLMRGAPGAWERMTDLGTVGKRAGVSAAMGMGAAGLGAIKSAVSAKGKENVKDLSPETNVMLGIRAQDITTADNLAAYDAAVKGAKSRAQISGAQSEGNVLRAEQELDRLRQTGAASRLDDDALLAGSAEAQRRLSAPGGASGLSGEAQPLRQPPALGSASSSPSQASRASSGDPTLRSNVDQALPPPTDPVVLIRTQDARGYRHHRNLDGKFAPPPKKKGKGDPEPEERKRGGAIRRALDTARRYATGGRVLVGPVMGDTGGRADELPVEVPAGAYVIPADIVAYLGEGNTMAGMGRLKEMFGESLSPERAAGGAVPILISDGEFVVSPEQVAAKGGGDLERGHKVLDAMVLKLRKAHIDTLKSLPGPAKG